MKTIDGINDLWGDDLKSELKPGNRLQIAASYFSIYAFEALKNELKNIGEFEFIFTEPAFTAKHMTDKLSKERRQFHIPKQLRERNVCGSAFEIQLKNKLTQRAIAKECADWIREKAIFKSNSSTSPMQSFSCVRGEQGIVVYNPTKGFTAVDLGYQKSDALSNLIMKVEAPEATKTFIELFNNIWTDGEKLEDVTEAICQHIETVYQENSPEKIYFLMLYNIFREFLEELDEDLLPNDRTGYKDTVIWNKLYNFQKDAATGIINKLESFNGCILADSVGLGKTFTALAVIKYYELRNRSVLVLCPKKLGDNWKTFNSNYKTNILVEDRLRYDLLYHTDLSRNKGQSNGIDLSKINWGNYDLVVIDESHNFRNSGRTLKGKENRYEKLMNNVMKAGVKTKVLMLSATPVNNRFNDLKNQLALAYEGDSSVIQEKLKIEKTVEEIFRSAQASFNAWSKLPAEERTAQKILESLSFDFFKLLDSVTIARSRKHIETFYDTSEIGRFPKRLKPHSFRPALTNKKNVMTVNEIYSHLTEIKQVVYAPLKFVFPSRRQKYADLYDTETTSGQTFLHADRENALQSLMTVNLLKRLESSVHAFRMTLGKMEVRISTTLENISKFEKGKAKNLQAIEFDDGDVETVVDNDDFGEGDGFTDGKVKIDFADMDLDSWKIGLETDLVLIALLREEMEKVTPDEDEKLQHLKNEVQKKIGNPFNDNNRKVLIFTAFADTANYLYKHLCSDLTKQGVQLAEITGDISQTTLGKGFDFQKILTFFSPRSKEKALIFLDEIGEIDVLIGTDCISEGQNLQDCDYVINYDIHWNPVRIIQRFGRVDRLGSTNASIQLANYWPDISLDEYINLKERVESRMHIVDLSATGDDNVLSAKANDVSYRKEQLQRLQEEVIELEDLKKGVNITDLGLNDFRMDLINYTKENGDITHLPNGLHAVLPADENKGLQPGVIFALRNHNSEININRYNRLHPYYLLYISTAGEIIIDHGRVKTLLDLVRKSCKGADNPLLDICKIFNTQTDDGKQMDAYSELLAKAIQSIIDVKEEKDLDSLFSGNQTTALVDAIRGLEDFELIAFLVIQKQTA